MASRGRSLRIPTVISIPAFCIALYRAYQRVQPLTLAELWALPIMLRIVMIENLRRLAARIVESIDGRELADRFADELLGLGASGLSNRPNWPFDEDSPLPRASAAQLYQRLRYADAVAAPALLALTERLAKEGTDPEEIVRLEVDRQTAADLSVRNLITSLRLISSFEWQQFVEAVSLVHRALCEAPQFSSMDFITRDRYRHAVEELARQVSADRTGGCASGGASCRRGRRRTERSPVRPRVLPDR